LFLEASKFYTIKRISKAGNFNRKENRYIFFIISINGIKIKGLKRMKFYFENT
jgi:hypothetical protein